MYFSLNKKIFYTIFGLIVFMAILFLSLFQDIYSKKYVEDRKALFLRNQYVVQLLNENIALRRELNNAKIEISHENQKAINLDLQKKQEELSRERRLNADLQKNYDEQTEAFTDGIRIIGISSLLSLVSIIILGFLLQKWVIVPIRKLAAASRLVAEGNFSSRIVVDKKQVFLDEFDLLSKTFNTMIDNIESKISEIKETEGFLQSLIDAIPDGIRVIDRHYNIVMANKAYMKQIGVASSIGQGKCYSAYNYDSPCPKGSMTCPLREIKGCGSKSISFIQNMVGRPLSINAAPLRIRDASDGKDFYIIESIRDLSDDIRFSHEQKIASLGFLATSVAHEMKNNLGSIRMILEGLLATHYKDLPDTNEEKKYLTMIYKQVVSSINIPERLLRLARNNSEDAEVFNIAGSIVEVLSLLDYEAKRNGIMVNCNFENKDYLISGNAADFQMIILNLAQNALKAMPSGGSLTINLEKDKNYITVHIIDTGIGISLEKIPHIFEPFYSDGHHNRQGTGLGLAIVKSLVEKFHGMVSVESEIGKGTEFTIKFPKHKRNKLQK